MAKANTSFHKMEVEDSFIDAKKRRYPCEKIAPLAAVGMFQAGQRPITFNFDKYDQPRLGVQRIVMVTPPQRTADKAVRPPKCRC